jgi:hypothetical protein
MSGNTERVKVREWRQRFERYQASGTTVENFCRRERVSVAMFYYWRREVGSIRLKPASVADRCGDFAPVRLVGSANVTVELPGGTRLEIPMADSDAFERALRSVVQADALRVEDIRC